MTYDAHKLQSPDQAGYSLDGPEDDEGEAYACTDCGALLDRHTEDAHDCRLRGLTTGGVVADSTKDRAGWLLARQAYVCGSEVAAMLGEGAGDNNTRAQLVMLKAGLAEPWAGNESSETGRDLEESGFYQLRAKRKWGWNLRPCGLLLRDTVCPQLAATPDFILDTQCGPAVVQAKGSNAQAQEDCKPLKSGAPSTAAYASGPPIYYVLQIQAELACTGLEWGALLVLHAAAGAWKLRAYPVRRHEALIARIRAEAPKVLAEAEALKAGRIAV